MKKNLSIVYSLSTIILISFFPFLLFYGSNVHEMRFTEILPVYAIFLIIGLVVYGIFALITRKSSIAAICSVLFLLLILNYRLLEDGIKQLIPFMGQLAVAVFFLLLFLIICILLILKLKKNAADILCKIVSLVMIGLVVINVVMIATALIKTPDNTISNNGGEEPGDYQGDRPNVYMLFFDEYSTPAVMKKYYDYNNDAFYQKLEKLGFTVSTTSYSHSIDTYYVLADIFNMKYDTTRGMPKDEKIQMINNGDLFSTARSLGYDIYELESLELFQYPSLIDVKFDNIKAEAITGETSTQLLLQKTALYPFSDIISQYLDKPRIITDGTTTYDDNSVMLAMDYLSDAANFPVDNGFVVAYICCPHVPFQFDRDGNIVDWANRANWTDPKYYLDQYIYITERIEIAVENIVANDPNAIIILQSDHGARKITENMPEEDMHNILNAVYWQGKEIPEIAGYSQVDTARIVLSKTFGLDLPPIKDATTQQISLEKTGIKYQDQSKKRYALSLYPSDILRQYSGNTLTFTNDVQLEQNIQYYWIILDENGKEYFKTDLSDDNRLSYKFEENGKYYAVAGIKQIDAKSRIEKIFTSIEVSDAGITMHDEDMTYGVLKKAEYTVSQNSTDFTITSNLPTDTALSYRWLVYDSSHNAVYSSNFGQETTFTYTPPKKGRYIIHIQIQYKNGRYEESDELGVAAIRYHSSSDTFEIVKIE